MKFMTIRSGSNANSIYINQKDYGILIDAGAGIRTVESALSEAGCDAGRIAAVFITHEHIDHIRALPALVRKYHVPVFANAATCRAILSRLKDLPEDCLNELPTGKCASCPDLKVTSFKTSHDAAESVGYTVTDGVSKFSVATDLGVMTEEVLIHIRQSDALVLESNYDENMLKNGIYPLALQQRILSEHGHLSNDSCAVTAAALVKGGTRKIVLGHLSENNNTPMVAYTRTVRELEENGIVLQQDVSLMVASREKNSALLEVRE